MNLYCSKWNGEYAFRIHRFSYGGSFILKRQMTLCTVVMGRCMLISIHRSSYNRHRRKNRKYTWDMCLSKDFAINKEVAFSFSGNGVPSYCKKCP